MRRTPHIDGRRSLRDPLRFGTSSGGDPLLSSGVFAGVIIGVALSLGWLVFISASPEMPRLGRLQGTQVFRSVEEYPDSETSPGLLAMRFDAGLFFAGSDALEDRLRELAQDADTPYDTIIISFEGVDFIDSQGSEKLAEILDLAETYGAEIRLAHVKPSVLSLLRRDGVIDTLGEDNVYGNVSKLPTTGSRDATRVDPRPGRIRPSIVTWCPSQQD